MATMNSDTTAEERRKDFFKRELFDLLIAQGIIPAGRTGSFDLHYEINQGGAREVKAGFVETIR